MLPFLQPRKASATIIERRKANGESKPTEQPKESTLHPKLTEAAEHIMSGAADKDSARVAQGLQMAFEHLSKAKDENKPEPTNE